MLPKATIQKLRDMGYRVGRYGFDENWTAMSNHGVFINDVFVSEDAAWQACLIHSGENIQQIGITKPKQYDIVPLRSFSFSHRGEFDAVLSKMGLDGYAAVGLIGHDGGHVTVLLQKEL